MGHAGDAAVEAILRAASAGEPMKVFYLGPFARRISFATQQTRALNLVWALNSRGLVKEGDEVAVVGAGLSGITAAASLAELRCKVTVLEATGVALWRQAQTEHRVVHPNINQWPEKAADPTTAFPFFDWYASECASALRMVLNDWKESYIDKKRVEFLPGIRVDKPIPAGEKIAFRLSQGEHDGRYDAVIVATGFSNEVRIKGLRGFTSYWDPDRLEHLRDEDKNSWFLVTGCGDGGLIDTLRLVFRTETFRKGRLAIEIAERLGQADLMRQPADPPSDKVPDIIHDAETRASPSAVDSDSAAHILLDAYVKAARLLPKDIADDLRDALVKRDGIVTLVGKEPHPYSRGSAPIHKLLLTFATLNGKLHYEQGLRDKDAKGTVFVVNGHPYIYSKMKKTVTRHGAPLALEGSNFLSSTAFDDLEGRQREILDIFNAPHWQSPPGGGGHPSYDPMSKSHIAARELRAKEFFARYWPMGKLAIGTRGFTLNLKRAKPDAKAPSSVFGISLKTVKENKGAKTV